MKKLFFAILFTTICTSHSFSQITKASVVGMLTELGSSIDKVETLFIGNVKTYYNDGTWKKEFAKYNKTWSKGTNAISVSDLGIVVKSYENGALYNIRLYPFSSILNISVEATFIDIQLKE